MSQSHADGDSISQFYEHDHDELDEMFNEYRRLKHDDFKGARDHFNRFYEGLMTHIDWEEDILFPLFEEKIGMGLTGTMRREHEQIQDVLVVIRELIKKDEVPTDETDEELLKFLGPHNESEESVVYPAIDQHLSDEEIEMVFDQMEDH